MWILTAGLGDDYVSKHICNSEKTYMMCPACEDEGCPPYYISDICSIAQVVLASVRYLGFHFLFHFLFSLTYL